MMIYRASLDTSHFSFEAFDVSALRARAGLLKGLMIHGKSRKLPVNWYEELICDISVAEREAGAAYRDHTKLVP